MAVSGAKEKHCATKPESSGVPTHGSRYVGKCWQCWQFGNQPFGLGASHLCQMAYGMEPPCQILPRKLAMWQDAIRVCVVSLDAQGLFMRHRKVSCV